MYEAQTWFSKVQRLPHVKKYPIDVKWVSYIKQVSMCVGNPPG